VSYTPVTLIEVWAWGRLVGAVQQDPDTGFYAFEYDEPWIASGADLSPIHLPRRPGVFLFTDLSIQTFYGLPAMLADSLPDRFGNALVDAWMLGQGIDLNQVTAIDRLAYAGSRAMGALVFAPPANTHDAEASLVQVADLVTAARAQIAGTLDDDGVHAALAELITVGSTAGGARAKAVVAYNPLTDQIRSGQFDAPHGFEQWLLKLDGVGDPTGHGDALVSSEQYCRVEYAYYLMAQQAGVSMSPSKLLNEGPRAHFMTQRFDRGPDNERIHTQTLCALGHFDYNMARTHSYSSYFWVAGELGLGSDAFHQIFRRVAFNVMGANRDDHTKNFSFMLDQHREWQLAPAYDVTHSYWDGGWTQTHQMSVNGKFDGITLDDLRIMADLHDVPAINKTLREVSQAIDAWPDFAHTAGVNDETTARISGDIDKLRPK
jgi:serine/threonine-protein kinase HipA